MEKSVSRKITKVASVMIILVLLIGGAIYLRTVSNAESLDKRNLRELSRIGQGVEGRMNNLRRVVKNLAADSIKKNIEDRAKLIPLLNINTTNASQSEEIKNLPSGKTIFKTNVATDSLELWHAYNSDSTKGISATYSFESLRPTLSSEYMETIFLANGSGAIFLWETKRTGIRIHELAALDTLHFKDNRETGGIGKSNILQTSIAGQEYRFYLLPIRVHFSDVRQDSNSDKNYTNWILGGLVPNSDYSQQSFSLDPNLALFLGFLVIGGFLIVPFVRIFTMGPKERLKVGNLFYLVLALIFWSGLAGLWLADMVHFTPLREEIKIQLEDTADQMTLNIDLELQSAIEELERKTTYLSKDLSEIDVRIGEIKNNPITDSLYLMKDNISFDHSNPYGTYPFYQMVFWADSNGEQLAKWTPRKNNTPRINVGQRDYFKAVQENRGWKQKFHTDSGSPTCSNINLPNSGSLPYYVESIRSWNTGENLAAISIPWAYKNEIEKGVAVMITKLASLTTPVLPTGVGFAVVDSDARTLFHSRPERILNENFAEETDNGDLLRSIIAARSCPELEMNYEGQSKLMAIRPLNERPLYLILFKDLSLIDTVRFEAWFEGSTLFGIWVLMIVLLIFFLERLPSSRMDWIWPDLKKPGKYTIFTISSIPFLVLLFCKTTTENHPHIHPAALVIPMIYLGLGLVVLYHGFPSVSNGRKRVLGWVVSVIAILILGLLTWHGGLETTLHELIAILTSLCIIGVWLRYPRLQDYINRWSNLSTRGVYTAALVSGLLVLGLLPGYIAYRFTFHDHNEHLVKYHQLELAESLQNRRARIDDLMQDIWKIDNWWYLLAHTPALSIHNTYDLAYDSLIFRTRLQQQIRSPKHKQDLENPEDHDNLEADLHDSMHRLLEHHIPFLTDASVKMRQLSSQPADRSWNPDHETHKLHFMFKSREILTSKLPVPGSWLHLWRLAILLAVIGGFGLIVYRVSRWLFFLHLEHSDPLTLKDVIPKPGGSWKSTIFVGTRSISRQPLLNRKPEIRYIDLIEDLDGVDNREKGKGDEKISNNDSDSYGEFKNLLEVSGTSESDVVCLDHFDHRIDEKERNLYLLKCLEKYMLPNNTLPVMILTSRELDESLLTANMPEEKKDEIKHRWDRVLGCFSKMILSDYVSDKPFRTLLRFRIIHNIADSLDQLLNDLDKYTKTSDSNESSAPFKESLAELVLKTDWLKDELQYLASPNCTLTKKHITTTGTIKKRLEKTLENIKVFGNTIIKKETYTNKHDWIKQLPKIAEIAQSQIDLIDRGPEMKKPLPDENRAIATLSPIHFIKNMSIWFLFDSEMEARRVVYRDKKRIQKATQALVQECGHHQRLQEIGEQLTYRPDWHTLSKDEIIDLIREGAEAHYRARWAILSPGEQLVAAQLSRGAVVNPKSHQAISRLFARGLIGRSPELRLDNASFSDFVENTVSEDQLYSWEKAGIPSTWEMIRAPLLIALTIVTLFLFWSQREFMGNTVAFLGTIGVGAGAIFNLLSKFGHIAGKTNFNKSDQ